MDTNFTKTESRVLRAIRLLDEVAADEYKNVPDVTATRFLHGWTSILSAVRTVSNGRASSDRQVSDALRKLVERGLVEKNGDPSRERPLYILKETT